MLVDHHTHIFSEQAREVIGRAIGREIPSFTGQELSAALDLDDVARAVVLSVAYMHSDSAETSAENDWVLRQCATDVRTIPFFSVNPLAMWAVAEAERCLDLGAFAGMKLHFANSQVDLLQEQHRQRIASVLRPVAAVGLPVIIHLRANRTFGAKEVGWFLREIAPAAGASPLQLAHAGGWGGYDAQTNVILGALRPAIADYPLFLDLSAVVRGNDPASATGLLGHLESIPSDRVLFGTDWPDWTARDYLRTLISLGTDPSISSNTAPWIN